jgi:hypothetical protein
MKVGLNVLLIRVRDCVVKYISNEINNYYRMLLFLGL